MQFFRQLIGYNDNIEELLNISRKLAKNRIIVKRPCYAQSLFQEKVHFTIFAKNHRFDIYNPW